MANLIDSKRQKFIDEYLSNGNNATQAYKKVYPRAKNATCRTNGCLWLQDPAVKKRIRQIQYKASLRSQVTVDRQLQRLEDLAEKSENKEDITNAIKAIQEQNKLLGLYEVNHLGNLNPESTEMYNLDRLSEDELMTLQKILNKAYIGKQ